MNGSPILKAIVPFDSDTDSERFLAVAGEGVTR